MTVIQHQADALECWNEKKRKTSLAVLKKHKAEHQKKFKCPDDDECNAQGVVCPICLEVFKNNGKAG